MTPPDGRDVAEAAVDLEGVFKRPSDEVRMKSLRDRMAGYVIAARQNLDTLYPGGVVGLIGDLAEAVRFLSPQEHDQGGGDVEARAREQDRLFEQWTNEWADCANPMHTHGPLWRYLSGKWSGHQAAASPTPATAGEPSPSQERALLERIGRSVGADHYTLANVAEQVWSEYRAILALRTASASSLEGGGAIAEIAAERQRQISEEGWSLAHDDGHARGEIANAAADWAMTGQRAPTWCWAKDKAKHPRRRQLVIAGALILAEIERLDRAALAPHQPEGGDNGRG